MKKTQSKSGVAQEQDETVKQAMNCPKTEEWTVSGGNGSFAAVGSRMVPLPAEERLACTGDRILTL